MRRVLGAVAIAVSLVPALAAGASTENVRDDFGSVSYSNSDGSRPWSGSWVEQGESDGPGTGQVSVRNSNCSNNMCLEMRGGPLGAIAIARKADLSGMSTAILTFDLDLKSAGVVSTGILHVQARGNGSGWKTLKTYVVLTSASSASPEFDVSHLAGPDFELRFRLDGVLGGDIVNIDRVEVEGTVAATTTTTVTTSTTSTTTPEQTTSTSLSSGTPAPTSPTTTDPSEVPTSSTTVTTTTTPTEPVTDEPESPGDTTSTTLRDREADPGGGIDIDRSPGPPPGSGLRVSTVGVMADYRPGPDGDTEIEVLGAELEAEFALAVETFETARIWLAILSLLIAATLVSGMDRKRSGRPA